MLRWKHLLVVAALITLVSPLAVYADKDDITGSSLVFRHDAVIPPSEGGGTPGFDPDDNFAFIYEVSGPFYGMLVTGKMKKELPYQGTGNAVVYVYVPDENGVYEGGVAATFSGSFTWVTAKGEITGTFEGIEYATGYPIPYPIPTDIFIESGGGHRCS